jgi:hypothetical protein
MGAVGSNLEGALLIDATAIVAIAKAIMPPMTTLLMETILVQNEQQFYEVGHKTISDRRS